MAKDYKEERKIREEFAKETGIDATINRLATFLDSGSMPEAKSSARKSAGSNENSYPSGMPEPEDMHVDIEKLSSQMGTVLDRPHYSAPSGNVEGEYSVSPQGNWILRRKTTSQNLPVQQELTNNNYLLSSQDMNSLLGELSNFTFSQENKMYEIDTIKASIRDTLNKLKAQRIASNSKGLSKNAETFTRTSKGGIRGIFNFLGVKISMLVEGDFYGDETFNLIIEGDKAVGIVLRKDQSGRFVDASDGYNITVSRHEG